MNQKEIAIQCLKKLDIYKPYIRKFEKEDMPTFLRGLPDTICLMIWYYRQSKRSQEKNDVLSMLLLTSG